MFFFFHILDYWIHCKQLNDKNYSLDQSILIFFQQHIYYRETRICLLGIKIKNVLRKLYQILFLSEMKKKRKAWIVKPPNWFCGIGISLIDDISKLPRDIFNFTTPGISFVSRQQGEIFNLRKTFFRRNSW